MTQRAIEVLIGRLITDEQFRRDFLRDPHMTVFGLCDLGLELSRTEIAAVLNTDPRVWDHFAEFLDTRLQKASLKDDG